MSYCWLAICIIIMPVLEISNTNDMSLDLTLLLRHVVIAPLGARNMYFVYQVMNIYRTGMIQPVIYGL